MSADGTQRWILGLRYVGLLCRDSKLEKIRSGLAESTWDLALAQSAAQVMTAWSDLDGTPTEAPEAAEISRHLQRGTQTTPVMRELLARSLQRFH